MVPLHSSRLLCVKKDKSIHEVCLFGKTLQHKYFSCTITAGWGHWQQHKERKSQHSPQDFADVTEQVLRQFNVRPQKLHLRHQHKLALKTPQCQQMSERSEGSPKQSSMTPRRQTAQTALVPSALTVSTTAGLHSFPQTPHCPWSAKEHERETNRNTESSGPETGRRCFNEAPPRH